MPLLRVVTCSRSKFGGACEKVPQPDTRAKGGEEGTPLCERKSAKAKFSYLNKWLLSTYAILCHCVSAELTKGQETLGNRPVAVYCKGWPSNNKHITETQRDTETSVLILKE